MALLAAGAWAAMDAPAKVIPLKGKAAAVSALLVVDLEGADMAGFSQALTANAIETGNRSPMGYRFNQEVGPDMERALDSAVRGLQLRHGAWPRGQSVEFTFREKYSPKDGPSAATACALILDSLITGDALDETFAVTGDMNSDLTVQPVGGVPSKIRGAAKGGSKMVAVPKANVRDVEDMVVMDGFAAIGNTQIFSIATFDEARALAVKERSAAVKVSIDEFAKLQSGQVKLRTPEGKALIDGILQKTPNHLSADLMRRLQTGKAPTRLSLVGSIDVVRRTTAPFFNALNEDRAYTINGPAFEKAMTTLSGLGNKLDLKVTPYHNAMIDFLTFARRYVDKDISNRTEYARFREDLEKRINRVNEEWKKLLRDPAVVEAIK
ncbi:MAG: S16 family serine protease [Verrucomicrobiales bacterium]